MSIYNRAGSIARKLSICVRNSIKPRFWRHMLSRTGIALIEWDTPVYKPRAETRSLHRTLPDLGQTAIQMPIVPRILGDTPYGDLIPLCTLVRHFQPRSLFEFGTHMGATTLQMLANCPPEAHIWTLDLPPDARQTSENIPDWDRHVDDHHVGRFFRNTKYACNITQILGNSLELDTMPFARSMDFIYIDASHTYDFVLSDSHKAFEMLAPGGVIVWHDYIHCEGVRQCIDELAQTRSLFHIEETILAVYIDAEHNSGRDSTAQRLADSDKNGVVAQQNTGVAQREVVLAQKDTVLTRKNGKEQNAAQ